MNDDGMNDDGRQDKARQDNGIHETKSTVMDARVNLYLALSTVQDALAGGYHNHRPLPVFSPEEPLLIAAPQTTTPQGTPRATSQQPLSPQKPKTRQAPDYESLATLAPEIVRCRACRLAITRKLVVPGIGVAGSPLFILGEYPSEDEKAGQPFSLDAGQLMARMLAAIGLDRQRDCFETTTVKCRPPMDRDPAPDELAFCLPFLERQLLAVQPKAILAFGRISAQILLGSKEALPRFRGTVHNWRGIPLVVTYHPEAILKDENLKRPAWEDLKLLKTILDDA